MVPAVARPTSATESLPSDPTSPKADLLTSPELTIDPASTIMVLYGMLQSMRDVSAESGEKRAQTANVEAKNEINKAADEELKKQEEERNRTFWDDVADVFSEIGKWVGAVASTVAAVMTCGAASPLAALAVTGAALSVTSTIDSTCGISKALLGDEAARWLNLGMSLGGAICSGGAAIGGLAAKAPEVSASAVRGAAEVGTGALTAASAASSGMGAVAHTAASQHEAAADMAAADEQAAVQRQQRLERLIAAITEALTDIVTARNRDARQAGQQLQDWSESQLAIMRA